ncbi:MAG: hypothetical protein HZA77_10015 [Candidatus Schekmanbacteria bacterium]|nr:hypothetical protein [Candidatus Schekmanbacteria bacterium]
MTNNFSIGRGRAKLDFSVIILGNDISISISGGTKPHVGAVALSIPRPSLKNNEKMSSTTSLLAVTGHKDDEVAKSVAEKVASSTGKTVVTIAGIHIDNASVKEIEAIRKNAELGTGRIISSFNNK